MMAAWPSLITTDGTIVAEDTNGLNDLFLRDRNAGTTIAVSVNFAGTIGNARTGTGFLSGDGNAVAFESDATNLVSGDTNGVQDVFYATS